MSSSSLNSDTFTNGQVLTFELPIGQIRTKANAEGKYFIRTAPHDIINPNGAFGYTEAQMDEFAQLYGITNWRVLASAIANSTGGCKLTGKAIFCKAGETDPNNPNIVYGDKNWWRTEDMNIVLDGSALNFVNNVVKDVLIAGEMKGVQTAKNSATQSRLDVIMGRAAKDTDSAASVSVTDLEDESKKTGKKTSEK